MESPELCPGCAHLYQLWHNDLLRQRRDWANLFPANQICPSYSQARNSPGLFPFREVPFGQHCCRYGRIPLMGDPPFQISLGSSLRWGLENFLIRLRMYVGLLLPMPLSGEQCRARVPLVCRLPLYGGLRHHWGRELGVRCQLQLDFSTRNVQRPSLSCRVLEMSFGSSGPSVGDLDYKILEVVCYGAFGPRLDVAVNNVHLQWVETVPWRRADAHKMPVADWLSAGGTPRVVGFAGRQGA